MLSYPLQIILFLKKSFANDQFRNKMSLISLVPDFLIAILLSHSDCIEVAHSKRDTGHLSL